MIHRHLSRVMSAVIHALMRVNVAWGMALVRYWTSVGSKDQSAAVKAGVKQIFVQISVARHPISDIARPEDRDAKKYLFMHILFNLAWFFVFAELLFRNLKN